MESNSSNKATPFNVALLSGGFAGLTTDVALFPLDTIKTRLQSQHGFFGSGGFRGIYSGLASITVGSVPGAALFFCTYEGVKSVLEPRIASQYQPFCHMTAASFGEVVACIVRVPTEVVKQRAQAAPVLSSLSVLRSTLSQEGMFGLYRGYWSTVVREVPFSFIQFPLWEYFKKAWSTHQGRKVEPWQSSICGALSGGLSAAITTPVDVAKTRIMLAEKESSLASGRILHAAVTVYRENGIKGCFAGILPRTAMMTLGGTIFLGAYDKIKKMLMSFDR